MHITDEDRAAALDAGDRLMNDPNLSDEERVRLTGVHRHGLLAEETSPTDDALAFVREHGVFCSEGSAPKSAPTPKADDDHEARVKRLREVQRFAERHDELIALADNLPRAAAEQALMWDDLERADETGRLTFGLSDRERAAAELLRGELNYKAELRELRAEMKDRDNRDGLALDESRFGGPGKASDAAPEAVWFTDSHGTRLLCF